MPPGETTEEKWAPLATITEEEAGKVAVGVIVAPDRTRTRRGGRTSGTSHEIEPERVRKDIIIVEGEAQIQAGTLWKGAERAMEEGPLDKVLKVDAMTALMALQVSATGVPETTPPTVRTPVEEMVALTATPATGVTTVEGG